MAYVPAPIELKLNSLRESTEKKNKWNEKQTQFMRNVQACAWTARSLTAVVAAEEAGLVCRLDGPGGRMDARQGLGHHIVGGGFVQPVRPVRQPLRIPHRVAPVVGVALIGENPKIDAGARSSCYSLLSETRAHTHIVGFNRRILLKSATYSQTASGLALSITRSI